MQRTTTFAVFALLILTSAASANGEPCVQAPPGYDADRFPYQGPMTNEQITELGLTEDKLDYPCTVLNWDADRECFVPDQLPAGTSVLVDETGTPRYKTDCGNPLTEVSCETPEPEPRPCPTCPPTTPSAPQVMFVNVNGEGHIVNVGNSGDVDIRTPSGGPDRRNNTRRVEREDTGSAMMSGCSLPILIVGLGTLLLIAGLGALAWWLLSRRTNTETPPPLAPATPQPPPADDPEDEDSPPTNDDAS